MSTTDEPISGVPGPPAGNGSTTGPLFLGGIRVPIGAWGVGFEVRHQSGEGKIPAVDDFAGTSIDLGGFTYNFMNPHTAYQSGIAMHLEVSASQSVTERLNREIVAAIAQPDVKQTWSAQGIFPEGSTSTALGDRVARDITKWRDVITRLGVQIQAD